MAEKEPPRDRDVREASGVYGEEVRQGRIVLNTPLRRWVFFGGLVGIVVVIFLSLILL